ncbi:MAG: LCP family protein [Clostridia bacterium]|nr:LCP family protein [Clostridia bacterium]
MKEDNNQEFVDISSSAVKSVDPHKKSKKKLLVIKVICCVLAVIFLVGGVASIGYYSIVNKFNYEDIDKKPSKKPASTSPTGETDPDVLIFDNEDGNLLTDPYILNIMLFGADQYGNEGLSDTMILLSIDNRHEKIKMTSFLRDTYISIPGYYSSKLNAAYALGGAELSIATIESNYGIQIDRYAIVNFETFKEIVDIMGGVEIYLTQDEIYYINDQIAQNGQSEYLPYDTVEGMVTLNGQQALWYARNRGGYVNGTEYGGSDWDRVERQRKFLNAVIDQLKTSASLTEIVQIVNAVGPNITTNLKNSEITTLVSGALTYLSYEVQQLSVPTEGTWSYGYNEAGSVILVDNWNRARYDLAKFIYEDSVVDTYSYY